MDPDDFETVVKLNEKDIEILGNMFTQYFVKCQSERKPVDCSLQSALLRKILEARETQIIEARAAGKFESPKLPQKAMEPEIFGGKPGEPVPEVDPEDVKTVWQIGKDAEARNPGKNFAIGLEVFKHACRPGANVQAVFYRQSFLWMMSHFVPEDARFKGEGQPDDAVFNAAAKVRAEWRGEGRWQTAPFDVNEFLRLCEEGKQC